MFEFLSELEWYWWTAIGIIVVLIFILLMFWMFSEPSQPEEDTTISTGALDIDRQIVLITSEILRTTDQMTALATESLETAKDAWNKLDLVKQSVDTVNSTVPQIQQSFTVAAGLAKSSLIQAREMANTVSITSQVLLGQIDSITKQATPLLQNTINNAAGTASKAIDTVQTYTTVITKNVDKGLEIANNAVTMAQSFTPTIAGISNQIAIVTEQTTSSAKALVPAITKMSEKTTQATDKAINMAKTITETVGNVADNAINMVNQTAGPIVTKATQSATQLTGMATEATKNLVPAVQGVSAGVKSGADAALSLIRSKKGDIRKSVDEVVGTLNTLIDSARTVRITTIEMLKPVNEMIGTLEKPIFDILSLANVAMDDTTRALFRTGFTNPIMTLNDMQYRYLSLLACITDRMETLQGIRVHKGSNCSEYQTCKKQLDTLIDKKKHIENMLTWKNHT